MTAVQELQQTALQCAKYLKNMEGDGPKYLDVPTEHLTDYFSKGGKPLKVMAVSITEAHQPGG